MTRGHRGSLALRCWAFSSLSSCRFIPAHHHAGLSRLTSISCTASPSKKISYMAPPSTFVAHSRAKLRSETAMAPAALEPLGCQECYAFRSEEHTSELQSLRH